MEKGGLTRLLLIGALVVAGVVFLPKLLGGGSSETLSVVEQRSAAPEVAKQQEQLCELWTDRFHAKVSSRGAVLTGFELLSAKYHHRDDGATNLTTTPNPGSDGRYRQQLYTSFRNRAAAKLDDPSWNVKFDAVPWKLAKAEKTRCEFTWESGEARLRKVIRTTDRAYELEVVTTITNTASEPRRHAYGIQVIDWRTQDEVSGSMFRMSPLMTRTECVTDSNTERLADGDFEPGDYEDAEKFAPSGTNPAIRVKDVTAGAWREVAGKPQFASVSNAYFAQALVPVDGESPVCQLQVEPRGTKGADNSGAYYRARIAYPAKELAPGASSEYRTLAYIGPKERDVLAAAGGSGSDLLELIDLGFFSVIAKVLVGFLLFVHSRIPNWGLAIIVLTVTARTLLFPLSIPSIKNMIKMRQLKPEVDALNEKFKDDPQARGLAQMELWRKHDVSLVKGCLPQLASMPVWLALYTTLQTAVELYNIPFLWFPDLSQPDPYYILPFVIGATYFLQQKIMPQQGDPMQQKMMMYMMPAMFTVFMLFLPSGLGVYMFTNSLLVIVQQQAVEWYVRKRQMPREETEKQPAADTKDDQEPKKRQKSKRKGKPGRGDVSDSDTSNALLGKGKA